MKSVLVLAASMFITFSSFANTDSKNSESKETKSIAVIENVNALQLTGSIVDEKNNESLVGATIILDGKKYYSDLDGDFLVTDVKPGKYELVVELISYQPVSMNVDLTKNQNLKINLNQK